MHPPPRPPPPPPPQVLYKKLLRKTTAFDLADLQAVDPLMHDGLKKLLEYTPAEDVEAVFCRTFEVEWDEFGAKRTHELVPGGANVPVTGSNRREYVDKLLHWLLYTSVEAPFNDLYDGFSRVVHPSCTLLFSADDLELLMVGTPHLDFKELEVRYVCRTRGRSVLVDVSCVDRRLRSM